MSNAKLRRRTAAVAVSTAGVMLVLPALPAAADLVPTPTTVHVGEPQLVTVLPSVDPQPVIATISATAAQIQHDYIGSLTLAGPTSFDTPAGVYAGNDPTTIQAWDLVEPPVTVPVEQTALSTSDRQVNAVDGDGGPGCEGWYFDVDKNKGYSRTIRNRGTTYSMNNNSDGTGHISIKHSETMSGSVTISASAEVEAGVILSKVKATFGLSVTASIDWQTEVGYDVEAKPHKMTHLSGAIYGWTTTGHYYHENPKCVIDDDKGTITAFTPQTDQDMYNVWTEPAVG